MKFSKLFSCLALTLGVSFAEAAPIDDISLAVSYSGATDTEDMSIKVGGTSLVTSVSFDLSGALKNNGTEQALFDVAMSMLSITNNDLTVNTFTESLLSFDLVTPDNDFSLSGINIDVAILNASGDIIGFERNPLASSLEGAQLILTLEDGTLIRDTLVLASQGNSPVGVKASNTPEIIAASLPEAESLALLSLALVGFGLRRRLV